MLQPVPASTTVLRRRREHVFQPGVGRLAASVLGLIVGLVLIAGLVSPALAAAAVKPTVKHVSPAAGPTAGGTRVTIRGTHFTGYGKSLVKKVMFGSKRASNVHVHSTSILVVTAPAGGAGKVNVRVTTRNGTSPVHRSDRYTYQAPVPIPAPNVTGISPTTGPLAGGTSVTITGSDFSGATAVKFGSVSATSFSVTSAASITATAPAGTGTVDVTVVTASGKSATSAADRYTYAASVPSVTGLSPVAGPPGGGTAVTITGSGFTDATAVAFGTIPASSFSVLSDTSIRAVAPDSGITSGSTVDVTVTTPASTSTTSAADIYTYRKLPVVSGLSPSTGPLEGGTSVIVSGSGFTGATSVTFGGVAATSYTVSSGSSLTAVSPTGAAGTVDVIVTNPAGASSAVAADKFTYSAAAPSVIVSAVSPNAGPLAGGTGVTVTGSGFTGATAVTFGTTAATFTVVSDTSITATSPAASAGAVDITVTAPGGTSATSSADQFTYTAAPTVSAVSPTAGPSAGGATVTVTGSGFTGATAVTFGTTAATSFTVASDTSITATSPAVAASTVDVTVTGPGGKSATSSADRYQFRNAPAITGVSPSTGTTAGGTPVAIAGSGFTGAASVTFDGTAATFTVVSGYEIDAATPAGTGTVDIVVTAPGSTSATVPADQFTYLSPP